jgi:hypothetical protein
MPEIPTSWMAGEPDTYSIESLTALDNSALNELAAELRGWIFRESGILTDESGEEVRESECVVFKLGTASDSYPYFWQPVKNRNQSGELLQWAIAKGVDFMIRLNRSWPRITIFGESLITIEANDARAETIAFCAAMLAINGRLQ